MPDLTQPVPRANCQTRVPAPQLYISLTTSREIRASTVRRCFAKCHSSETTLQLAKPHLTRPTRSVEEYVDIDNEANIVQKNDDWEQRLLDGLSASSTRQRDAPPVIVIMMTPMKPLILTLQSVTQKLHNTPKKSNYFVGKITFPRRTYRC